MYSFKQLSQSCIHNSNLLLFSTMFHKKTCGPNLELQRQLLQGYLQFSAVKKIIGNPNDGSKKIQPL